MSYWSYFTYGQYGEKQHELEFDVTDDAVAQVNEDALSTLKKQYGLQYANYANVYWITKDELAQAIGDALTKLRYDDDDVSGVWEGYFNYLYIDSLWVIRYLFYELILDQVRARQSSNTSNAKALNLKVRISQPNINQGAFLHFIQREMKRIDYTRGNDQYSYIYQHYDYKEDIHQRLKKKEERKKRAPKTAIIFGAVTLAISLYFAVVYGIKNGFMPGVGLVGMIMGFYVSVYYCLRKLFTKEELAITKMIREEVPFGEGLLEAMIPFLGAGAGLLFMVLVIGKDTRLLGKIFLLGIMMITISIGLGIIAGVIALIAVAGRDAHRKKGKPNGTP